MTLCCRCHPHDVQRGRNCRGHPRGIVQPLWLLWLWDPCRLQWRAKTQNQTQSTHFRASYSCVLASILSVSQRKQQSHCSRSPVASVNFIFIQPLVCSCCQSYGAYSWQLAFHQTPTTAATFLVELSTTSIRWWPSFETRTFGCQLCSSHCQLIQLLQYCCYSSASSSLSQALLCSWCEVSTKQVSVALKYVLQLHWWVVHWPVWIILEELFVNIQHNLKWCAHWLVW